MNEEKKEVQPEQPEGNTHTSGLPSPENKETAPPSPDDQIATLKDLLLRKAAEFENYKRRTEAERMNEVRWANEGLILSMLPVVDDLERSLKAARPQAETDPMFKGVELIYQKLLKVLESNGVTPLVTEGKQFDVAFHDALMQVPRNDVADHTILQEVEKGYVMHGRVIRHAKVVVSSAAGDAESGIAASTSKEERA